MEKNNFKNIINNISDIYQIDEKIVFRWIDSHTLGDMNSMSDYYNIMLMECPPDKHENLKNELQKILKTYYKQDET